jgi:DNA-binding LacI/PurR family transcriptional regulator
LLAFDDLTAFAAIGALSNAGIRVPEGCSVVGFDDIPGAAYYNPPLTTINQHLETQGLLAAKVIKQMLSVDAPSNLSKHERVAPHLIVRKSTSRAPSARVNAK